MESSVLPQREGSLGQQQGSHKRYLRVLQRAQFSNARHERDGEYQHGHVGGDAKQPQTFDSATVTNAQYIQHGSEQQSQACTEDPDSAGISPRHEQAIHDRQNKKDSRYEPVKNG
jgi:hypothetical protein